MKLSGFDPRIISRNGAPSHPRSLRFLLNYAFSSSNAYFMYAQHEYITMSKRHDKVLSFKQTKKKYVTTISDIKQPQQQQKSLSQLWNVQRGSVVQPELLVSKLGSNCNLNSAAGWPWGGSNLLNLELVQSNRLNLDTDVQSCNLETPSSSSNPCGRIPISGSTVGSAPNDRSAVDVSGRQRFQPRLGWVVGPVSLIESVRSVRSVG